MVSWFAYAAASAALLVGLVVGVGALVESADPAALVLAAVVAWVVQGLAFAALVAGRKRGQDFLVSWAAGMLLRFAVVGGVAFWVTRSSELDAATALVGLVGFVMVLVLLEPLFLRRAD